MSFVYVGLKRLEENLQFMWIFVGPQMFVGAVDPSLPVVDYRDFLVVLLPWGLIKMDEVTF